MGTSLFRRKWTTVDFVLIVVTAALYAVALIMLANVKLMVGVPLRPANALQPVFGILFGIPGCLGLAFGNVASDLLTGSAPPHAVAVGFLGNFLGGYISYLAVSHPVLKTKRSILQYFIFVVLIASAVVACSILINVALGFTPMAIATMFIPTVFLNQAVSTAILGPFLLKLLYPFVKRAGLYRGRVYGSDLLPVEEGGLRP
ncbi:QueT transporter family protein [Brevibacillus composti]|uniref:QueT transporter family protein n=1 Tax=Brevibacillus composti TaxID=2796470 RepID=A0A7T5EKP2_9BACL|nr:QueT transporter family protein [Brevibacillus composti]QQE74301.1 QueT transporter family protein [Brevibacillus composti]QUO41383.1 QueT transporter family protein [Brevibacillus composti]